MENNKYIIPLGQGTPGSGEEKEGGRIKEAGILFLKIGGGGHLFRYMRKSPCI